jgi:hypothetical protein
MVPIVAECEPTRCPTAEKGAPLSLRAWPAETPRRRTAAGARLGRGCRRIVVDMGVILRDRTRVSDSDRPRFAAGCYLPRHQAEPGRPGSSTEVPRCGNLNTAAPLSGVACGSPRRRRRLTRPLIVPTSSTRMAGVDSVFVCEA